MVTAGWAPVEVVSSKWDGRFHRRTPSLELGSDSCGTWLWIPPGTIADTPVGPFEAIPGLRLLPVGECWLVYFVPSSPPGTLPASTYVDISTAVQRAGDRFEFVDLDLDIEQVGDGRPVVLDRDEFEDRRRRGSYPAEVAEMAETACQTVSSAMNQRSAPFDGSYLKWWNVVLAEAG